MPSKQVKYLVPAYDLNMGGIKVKQALPTQQIDQVDPYLLLHHGSFSFRDDAPAMRQGVDPHPHRGFSPVTFVIEGEVHHRDSRGNSQIAKAGEVQWMHAGAGIVHSERPSKALIERQGRQEIVQLWINSPSTRKMKIPSYQYLSEEEIPAFYSLDQLTYTKLIAGNYLYLNGRLETESPLLVLWSKSEQGSRESFDIPAGYNSMLYLVKGQISIEGYGRVIAKHLAIFNTEDQKNHFTISAVDDAEYLVLAGAPIEEKIAQNGPFVMNNETQILEAMRDYQMGKMGFLVEEP